MPSLTTNPLTALLPLLLFLLSTFPPTATATATPALETGFHLLNLTHIPIGATMTTTPDDAIIHNGSISFTLETKGGDAYATTHRCLHTFVAPTDKQAAGGPFACSDGWPGLLFYWREDDGDDDDDDDDVRRERRGPGREEEEEGSTSSSSEMGGKRSGSGVVLDIWFAFLDCRPNGGAVSESSSLALPPPTATGTVADGSRTWDAVYVPAQTASLTAWFPGQYEEVCLGR